MFVLEGKMSFINIDQNYLKQLHDICSEVYYKEIAKFCCDFAALEKSVYKV